MVVLFGLSNSLDVFMFLMNGVSREYLDKFVIVLLDDILMYSMCEEEHEKHLKMVIKVLWEHKLYYELNNYIFYQNNIHYLGNIISADGIAVQPEKIEAIRGWPMPRNVIEVR
jgi:hypothetical protein